MRKLCTLVLTAILGGSAADAGYNVSGRIDNNDGARIYLVTQSGRLSQDTIGSSLTADGSFSFSGDVDAPIAAEIILVGTKLTIPVMLEPDVTITVQADASEPYGWSITGGGKMQRIREDFRSLENEYRMRCDSIEDYYRSTYDLNDHFWVVQLRGAIEMERERFDSRRDSFVTANDNIVSASVLAADLRWLVDRKIVHEKYRMLGENARNTIPGRILKEEADKMSLIVVGGIAPDFTMPTPDGEMVTLHDVKAKVKIIDFWASWCGPCRAENPTLRKLYAEYAPKGLEIISVSIDTDKEAWIKAIEADKMVWKNVSELSEGNTARTVYNIYAVPHMFILDEDNRIISERLRGEKLIEFISAQFKD